MDDFGLTDLDDHRPQRQTRQREPVQEGTHEFQIVQVSIENYGFLFALDAGDDGLRYVWHRMDRDREVNKHLLRDLLRSLAISLEEWRNMDPTDLCDRRVRAEIYHKVDAKGTLWVNVGKFMPIEQLVGEAAEVARRRAPTPASEISEASGMGRDDVPFAWLTTLIVALIGGAA